MDLGLTNKVALVTGSSRGIGRGIALALAAEGCDVMLTGRDETALNDVVAAAAKFGRIDILVNNAGTTKRGDFLELSDADWTEGYGLKFFAHVRLVRAAWPLLV